MEVALGTNVGDFVGSCTAVVVDGDTGVSVGVTSVGVGESVAALEANPC